MPKVPNKFNGEQLKVVREQLGLTQGQAAEQIGISKRSLARFETGEGQPSRTTLGRIEKFFKEASGSATREGIPRVQVPEWLLPVLPLLKQFDERGQAQLASWVQGYVAAQAPSGETKSRSKKAG